MIHILVVDDDKELCRTVCTYLNDCGFDTKSVLNANDAYDEMYNSLYDLIISDIMMPEVDGFEFAENVRKVNRHIEKIVVHEKEIKWSKHAPQTVEIYYNGIGYVGSGQQDTEEALEAPQTQDKAEPRQAS